jgi:hypothetical protein
MFSLYLLGESFHMNEDLHRYSHPFCCFFSGAAASAAAEEAMNQPLRVCNRRQKPGYQTADNAAQIIGHLFGSVNEL